MTPAQARALFLDQLGPNDTLARYGEEAAVKAILAAVEQSALVAECTYDDRPRSRVGHPSQMDWDDGYRDGTRAAGAAIRAALSPKVPA